MAGKTESFPVMVWGAILRLARSWGQSWESRRLERGALGSFLKEVT